MTIKTTSVTAGMGVLPFYWKAVLRPNLRDSILIGSLMIVSATLEMVTIGLSVPLLESITSTDAVNQTLSTMGELLALVGLSAEPNVLVLGMLTFIIGLFIFSGVVRLVHEYLTASVATVSARPFARTFPADPFSLWVLVVKCLGQSALDWRLLDEGQSRSGK